MFLIFKYLCGIALALYVMPSFGATNSKITNLIKEKQQKYAQLEECSKKVNGFKIAGISTLGLTAVGIGGNIALASKNKQLDKKINGEGGLRSQLTKEQEKLEKKNAEISAEKLKIAEKNCNKDTHVWDGKECNPKPKEPTDNNDIQPVTNATVIENAEQTVENQTNQNETDLVLGTKCGSLPDGATDGKYSEDASGDKQCLKHQDTTEIVNCSCLVTACDQSAGYELVDNKCEKKEENNKPELIYEGVLGEQCAEATKKKMHVSDGIYVKANSNKDCLDKRTNTVVKCECQASKCDSQDYKVEKGLCTVKKEEPKTESFDGKKGSKGYMSWSYTDQNKYIFGTPNKCSISSKGEWCVDLGTSVIKGTAVCTSVDYYNKEDPFKVAKNQSLTNSNSDYGTRYCWCKTSTPNKSKWLYVYSNPYGGCAQNDCAYECASYVSGDNDNNFLWSKMRNGFKNNPE